MLAASWAFSEMAARTEASRVDSRLNAALRVAVADYADDVGAATNLALATARTTDSQQAFARGDRKELVRLAAGVRHSAIFLRDQLVAGSLPQGPAVLRSAVVVSKSGERIGRVVVAVPLNGALVKGMSASAELKPGDRLIIAAGRRVVAGRPAGELSEPAGPAEYIEIAGRKYRTVGTELLSGTERVTLVALAPRSEIDGAVAQLRNRLALFAFGALAFVGMLAYLFGRPIVRSLSELSDAARAVAQGRFDRRVHVRGHDEFAVLARSFNDMAVELQARIEELAEERVRVRDAIGRFGTALEATHDPGTLLRVVVESAVEATGAVGGLLFQDGREAARAGDPESGGSPLEMLVGEAGVRLLLFPPGGGFSDESGELARSLAAQASVALENARLHRRAKAQAVTDPLTELANRRQLEDVLTAEIGRSERFGGSLALVLADLDDFKAINDRYGHQTGDEVLTAFAGLLRRTVREIDVAARYGGEEFALLLPETDLAGGFRLAERIRAELAFAPLETAAGPIAVTASFGVASLPEELGRAELLAAADEALYRAKRNGKNCVCAAGEETGVRPLG